MTDCHCPDDDPDTDDRPTRYAEVDRARRTTATKENNR